MNLGQTLLTIMALMLLAIITLGYFSTVGRSGRNLSNTSAGITATTVATSFIERVESYAFDAMSDTSTSALDSSRFTAVGALGREDETPLDYKNYNDIDDFKGDVLPYSPGWMNEVYQVKIDVNYADPYGDINIACGHRTFLKRITVRVWRSYPPADTSEAPVDTVQISALQGYFFFNPI